MINDMLIETIVATGLRRKPVFRWSTIAHDLKAIVGYIARGDACMPTLSQEPADNNRKIGLAYILANLHENSDKKAWANTGLRRQGTVALQMGFEIATAIEKYPYFLDAIKEYIGSEFAAEAAKDEISVYGLLLSTALCRYVSKAEVNQELLRVCEKYNEVVLANPFRLDLVNEVKDRLAHSPDEIGTWFFANVANALFGEEGEKYTQDPEDVKEEQVKNGKQDNESVDDSQQDQSNQDAQGAGDGVPEQGSNNEQAPEAPQEEADSQAASSGQLAQEAEPTGSEASEGGEGVAEDEHAKAGEQSAKGKDEIRTDEGESQQQDDHPDPELQDGLGSQAELDDVTQVTDDVDQVQQSAQSEQSEEGDANELAVVTQETAESGHDEAVAEQQPHASEAVDLFEAVDAESESPKVTCVSGGGGSGLNKPLVESNRIEFESRTNGVLVSTIVKIFQATEEQPTGLSKCGSKVSIKHAWRMKALGDTRIFKKNREDPGVDMAMSILVDRSESMARLLRKVCNTAYTFALGLARVPGAKVRLAAFPAIGPTSTTTLLEFDEHTKRAEDRLSTLYADGSTPLAQAIVAECARLLERNEPKKVIAVLTDGVPDSGLQVKNAILRAESLGIEVIGIGFGDAKSITNWIEKAEYISEVDDLPNALASIFEKTLETQS